MDLTSDTPDRAHTSAAWADAHAFDYLAGAIMVPVEVTGGPQALIFYAGSRTAHDRYEAVLKALGASAPFHGPDHALAAAYDMAMPDFFHGSMAGPVHAFALARAENIPAAAIAPYLRTIVAGTAADNRILVPDSELATLRVDSGGAGEWRGILVRLRAVLDATGAPTLCRASPGRKQKPRSELTAGVFLRLY
ncbi:hypothetical protein P6B95_31660 [Streptomyces atratus]|uniref:imine reductase family protein n=1 Tax=Streptomyces atratus TaxID=1893 RepID=UPI002AC32352|nr:hypothetical protein [Streptomyces atratus]WPW31497.1 hypothetical protein P6B95_31660 [Streptomyces atratus]